jgi:hypothetical protein
MPELSMTGRTILATLDGKGPFERLEIALVQDRSGRLLIDLREQHYAEKIGWFDQRRMELDARQFQQLQSVLKLNDSTLNQIRAESDAPATIPFPGPSSTTTPKSAVGDGI